MFFRITKVVTQAFPDDASVGTALMAFGLNQDDIVGALTGYQTLAEVKEGRGHQQVLAQELERHLITALKARGLVSGRYQYSPRLGERPDIVLSKDNVMAQLYVEIEFRPNVEKDLVKFQIGANTGLLGTAILILAEDRDDINSNYTTMPEFRKYVELVHELRPSYALLMIGIGGNYVEPGAPHQHFPAEVLGKCNLKPSEEVAVSFAVDPVENSLRQPQVSGRSLNQAWKVGAAQAHYHCDGVWYHRLERFPGALFDPHGYVLFKTREEYDRCPYLSIGKHVNVRSGISSMPQYVRVRKTLGA